MLIVLSNYTFASFLSVILILLMSDLEHSDNLVVSPPSPFPPLTNPQPPEKKIREKIKLRDVTQTSDVVPWPLVLYVLVLP